MRDVGKLAFRKSRKRDAAGRVPECVAMSRDRAARYRRLAVKETDKEKAELLRLLADEADRGVLVTTEWLSARPYKKVEISEAGDKEPERRASAPRPCRAKERVTSENSPFESRGERGADRIDRI